MQDFCAIKSLKGWMLLDVETEERGFIDFNEQFSLNRSLLNKNFYQYVALYVHKSRIERAQSAHV